MVEGKKIVTIALDVFFAAIFLGVLAALGSASYNLWNSYEKSAQSSARQNRYSEYAAYDDTAVRGQEIVSLVSKAKGDVFVVVADSAGNVLAKSYDGYTGGLPLDRSCFINITGVNVVTTLLNAGTVSSATGTSWDYETSNPSSVSIQEFFLNGAGTSTPGQYCAYSTYLVYEGNSSTDIIGVLAVRN